MTKHKEKTKKTFPKIQLIETQSEITQIIPDEETNYEILINQNIKKIKKYRIFVWAQFIILFFAFFINFRYLGNIKEWYQDMGLGYTMFMVFNSMFFLIGAFTALTFDLEKRVFKKNVSDMSKPEFALFTNLTVKQYKWATILLFFLLTNRFIPLIYATPITSYFAEIISTILPVSKEIAKWIFSAISWFFANIGFNIIASFIFQIYWERYGKHKYSGTDKTPKKNNKE